MKYKREVYYNYFDEDGMPAVTVCLLYDGENASRGVSVWNRDEDVWDEETGKFYAKCYAERALKGRNLDAFNTESVVDTLIECDCPFKFHGELNPDFSFKEAKMLFSKKHMRSYFKRFVRVTYEPDEDDNIISTPNTVWMTWWDRSKVVTRKDIFRMLGTGELDFSEMKSGLEQIAEYLLDAADEEECGCIAEECSC